MTYEEAKKRHIELWKIDIKRRLHKINHEKYPDNPKPYSTVEAWDVAWTLVFKNPSYKNPFERDDIFYKALNKK